MHTVYVRKFSVQLYETQGPYIFVNVHHVETGNRTLPGRLGTVCQHASRIYGNYTEAIKQKINIKRNITYAPHI